MSTVLHLLRANTKLILTCAIIQNSCYIVGCSQVYGGCSLQLHLMLPLQTGKTALANGFSTIQSIRNGRQIKASHHFGSMEPQVCIVCKQTLVYHIDKIEKGCGKSVMVNFLSTKAKSQLGLVYFFKDSIDQKSTCAASLASSLLAQIFRNPSVTSGPKLAAMVNCISPLQEQFGTCDECPFQRLWPVVDSIFQILPSFTLMVDALDECSSEKECALLLRYLCKSSAFSCKKVILSSRFRPDIAKELRLCYHLAMDADSVSGDINLFVKSEVRRDPRLWSLENEILAKTTTDANGMFLWAKMMIEYLKNASTTHIQLLRLKKFPRGLVQIYTRFLSEKIAALEPEELVIRDNIFKLLIAAVRPLHVNEISTSLALRSSNTQPDDRNLLMEPENDIHRLCWPFVATTNNRAELVHTSVKEFFLQCSDPTLPGCPRFTYHDCQIYIARKCLYRLIHEDLASLPLIQSLMKDNVSGSAEATGYNSESAISWAFYQYACDNWHRHVLSTNASQQILYLLSSFLRSIEFVTWSEMVSRPKKDMGPVLEVKSLLRSWHCSLSVDDQSKIGVGDFFVQPYRELYHVAKRIDLFHLLPYLVLQRLGFYFNLTAEFPKDQGPYELRKEVAEGFQRTLGPSDQLTMRSVAEYSIERFVRAEFELSETALMKTMRLQKLHLEHNFGDCFYSQQYAALAMWHQMRFAESEANQKEASEGMLRTLGPTNLEFLKGRMFLGFAVEAQGDLDNACNIYESIWRLWTPLQGPDNPLSLFSQCCMAICLRKKKDYVSAERHLLEVLAKRQCIFGEKNFITIDTALHLALLYEEWAMPDQSTAYLDLAESMGLVDQSFERICQFRHIQVYLKLDEHRLEDAKKILEGTLTEANSNNFQACRELLWMRITLANVLRALHQPDVASLLFLGLVKSTNSDNDSSDGAEPPAQLALAEQAIRYAMANNLGGADNLLQSENLEWRHRKMFWIMVGGPAIDTASRRDAIWYSHLVGGDSWTG